MLAHNWGRALRSQGCLPLVKIAGCVVGSCGGRDPDVASLCRLVAWPARRFPTQLPASSFNSSITKQAATGISDTTRSPAHFYRHRRRLRNRRYQLTAGHPKHTSTTSHSQLRRPEVPPSQWSVYRLSKLESLDYLLTFRRVKTSRVWEVATMARMTRTRRFATDHHPSSSTPTLLTMLS